MPKIISDIASAMAAHTKRRPGSMTCCSAFGRRLWMGGNAVAHRNGLIGHANQAPSRILQRSANRLLKDASDKRTGLSALFVGLVRHVGHAGRGSCEYDRNARCFAGFVLNAP